MHMGANGDLHSPVWHVTNSQVPARLIKNTFHEALLAMTNATFIRSIAIFLIHIN